MTRRVFRPGRVYENAEPLTAVLSHNNQIVYNSQLSYTVSYIAKHSLRILVRTLVIFNYLTRPFSKQQLNNHISRRRYAQSMG